MCVAEQTNSALHPRVKGYNKRFGRPVVAVSTQMCVAEYVISRLHPRVKGLQGFGALLRGHIVKARASCRIDQSRIAPTGQGLQLLLWAHTCVLQRGGRPIAAVSIHMCVCRRIDHFRVAPERQTNCCCGHTCCGLNQLIVAPEDQGFQGFGRPIAAVSTHM